MLGFMFHTSLPGKSASRRPRGLAGVRRYAEAHGYSTTRRPGKRVALFEVRETRTFASCDAPCVA